MSGYLLGPDIIEPTCKSKKSLKKIPKEIQKVREAHPGKEVKIWFEDEARLGQQGTLTRVWAKKGTRPTAIRQTQYQNLYVLTAACPETGNAEGMIAPYLNTDVMNLFLDQMSQSLLENEHAVLVLDQAGYHTSKKLRKVNNITVLYLPPYSPELNPIETLWHYLRDHYWSNRYYHDYEELEGIAIESWYKTCCTAEKIKSICRVNYL